MAASKRTTDPTSSKNSAFPTSRAATRQLERRPQASSTAQDGEDLHSPSPDALRSYLAALQTCAPLSREEELEIATAYVTTRQSALAEQLIRSNLRAVVKLAVQHRRADVGLLELIQEGNLGLIQAVERFEPERGIRLVTYASWWIRAYIRRYLQVHSPATLVHEPDTGKVRRLRGGSALREVPLQSPSGSDQNAPVDWLADDSPSAEALLVEHEDDQVKRLTLQRQLALLDPQEQTVIRWRFMHEEPRTLREIGEALSLSRQRIHQIETRACRKLTELADSRDRLPHPLSALCF